MKTKNYWLKGLMIGIIIAVISLIMFGIAYLTGSALNNTGEWISWLLVVPSLIPMIIASFIIGWGHTIISSVVLYPLAGLIIGWFYGKIKQKK